MSVDPRGKAGCEFSRQLLEDYLSGETSGEKRQTLEQHLADCPSCAAEPDVRRRVREQVRPRFDPPRRPLSLETNVRRALRGEGARPRTGLWAVAAAAAVILAAVLFQFWQGRGSPEEAILRQTTGRLAAIINVGLVDHLQCAVFRKYSRQPEPAPQMAAELGPEFAGLLPVIQAKLPADFRIIQGHHCKAGNRQYTHLIIVAGGKTMSLVLTPKRPGESLDGGIHQTGVDRFQVVGFESHGYLVYIISDLDAQQNLQTAANLAPALREFLAAHAG